MRAKQVLICWLLSIGVCLADDNGSNLTSSLNDNSDKVASRTAMKKVGTFNGASAEMAFSQENSNNNGGSAFPASLNQQYANYQAAAMNDEDDYQQAIHAAGLRSAMETSPTFKTSSYPYNNNFNGNSNNNNNNFDGAPGNTMVYVSQPAGNFRQDSSAKSIMDSAKNFQFDQQQTFDNSKVFVPDNNNNNNNNFVAFNPQASFPSLNNNNNNFGSMNSDFSSSNANINQNQQQQQGMSEITVHQITPNNNNNNFNNNNGQKQTIFKITGVNPSQLLGATSANMIPVLGNGLGGNWMAVPQGMIQHAFVPAMAFAPQMQGMQGNRHNFVKNSGVKQMSMSKTTSANSNANNNPGMFTPNTVTVPMFLSNMAAGSRLNSGYPGAFGPMMYPSPMFFPAFNPYAHPFGYRGNRGSHRNKQKSESRDDRDRDDNEDLFEDDPLDMESDE